MLKNWNSELRKNVSILTGIMLFSLAVTQLSFEYGITTMVAMSTTYLYYFIFEKGIDFFLKYGYSKFSVVSIYIMGLLRYVCVGGGLVAIFFLFYSLNMMIYAVCLIVLTWLFCVFVDSRR